MSRINYNGSKSTSLPPCHPPPPIPTTAKLECDNLDAKSNTSCRDNANLVHCVDENICKNLKKLTDELKEKRLESSPKKKGIIQEINKLYNKLNLHHSDKPQIRTSKVKFGSADPVVEVKVHDGFEDVSPSIEAYLPYNSTKISKPFNFEFENAEESFFMCKTKGNESLKPINLAFQTKTTVVIVDRRKTDNGSKNHLTLNPIMSIPTQLPELEASTSDKVSEPSLQILLPSPPSPKQPITNLPPPPAPPPPPPPISIQTKLKIKVHDTKDQEWKDRKTKSNDLITKRQEALQEINLKFNNYYNKDIEDTMIREKKVKFASGMVDLKQDSWYEDDPDLENEDHNEENTKSLSSSSLNEDFNQIEEDPETHYICRSKDTKTPQPINLCFQAKTTVIVVDRRKTDNGSHDFFCSLDVSKEGKQKLLEQRQHEAEMELESLPKGKIDQILNQLGGN